MALVLDQRGLNHGEQKGIGLQVERTGLQRREHDTGSEVLGPFRLSRDGVAIDTEAWQRKPAALLRMLAVSPGGRLSRDEVTSRFWPNAAPAAATANLRYVLYLLRRGLIVDPAAVVACLRAASAALQQGRAEVVLPLPERLVAEDPVDEELVMGLIETLVSMGRRVEALRTFRIFEARLREELDLEPPDVLLVRIKSLMLLPARKPEPKDASLLESERSVDRDRQWGWRSALVAGDEAMALFAYTEAEGHYRTAMDEASQRGARADAGERPRGLETCSTKWDGMPRH